MHKSRSALPLNHAYLDPLVLLSQSSDQTHAHDVKHKWRLMAMRACEPTTPQMFQYPAASQDAELCTLLTHPHVRMLAQ
jgi:hypothetical protein